jgi:hypothetical protein
MVQRKKSSTAVFKPRNLIIKGFESILTLMPRKNLEDYLLEFKGVDAHSYSRWL